MIDHVCNIFTFVEDQEKAKKFWTEKVGFEVKCSQPMGKYLWLEVVPKGSQTSIVLYPKSSRENAQKSESIITFFTKDIQKTYEELSSKGVKFTKEPENTGFGIFTEFYDEDGNIFSLKQV